MVILPRRNSTGEYGKTNLKLRPPSVGKGFASAAQRACNLALNTMRVLIAEKMGIVCLVNAVNDGCIFRLLVKSPASRAERGSHRGPRSLPRAERRAGAHRVAGAFQPCGAWRETSVGYLQLGRARLAGLQVQLEVGEVLKVECGAAGRRSGWYGWARTEPPWRATPDCSVLQACLAGDSP